MPAVNPGTGNQWQRISRFPESGKAPGTGRRGETSSGALTLPSEGRGPRFQQPQRREDEPRCMTLVR